MNVVVCGRMKEGKTSFALYAAHRWSTIAVAFDPRHMIDEEMATRAGFKYVAYVSDPEELQEEIDRKQDETLIVYRPQSMNLEEDFRAMCSILLDPPERYHNWALVVDEAASLQSQHRITPELSRAVRQHPRSVLIVQTSHSLQDWHRASKDLVNHVFAFRLVGRSLDAFVDFCDGSEEMREEIKNLPPHHMVHVSFESHAGTAEYEVIVPSAWWEKKKFDIESKVEYTGGEYAETSGTS